jgi:asparagine synthase (glutamine-hydrolysing)
MCGIAGILRLDDEPVDEGVLGRMADTLRHRGPDDHGVLVVGPMGLASRRLAIQDLSPRGHMPMSSEDGRYHIVFNGEIYNFHALRHELEQAGRRFRSGSDTEVVLEGYAQLGDAIVGRLRGMFAFAVWDARDRTLLLARDRLGKKPIYYAADGRRVAFASEPKALLQDPSLRASPDRLAIHHYLTWGYVPSPWCAFEGVRKLPPAHVLTVTGTRVEATRYWTLGYRPKRTGREPELVDELRAILQEATALRLISDVPVGALLSGGVDSSAIVALIRRVHGGAVRTFSIGFDDAAFDERDHAAAVARHLETEHHALVVRPDAMALVPRLAWHYDEPFADSSAIPSFALSALARTRVTVALGGDGGDESFLGYERYLAARAGGLLDTVPRRLRVLASRTAPLFPRGGPKSRRYRARRLVESLGRDAEQRYAQWMMYFDGEAKRKLYGEALAPMTAIASETLLEAAFAASDADTFVERAAHADVQTYLPDDLLVKMDIASMAHSLEVRSPLLDHHVVEFAAALPLDLKLRGLTQKYLLKAVARPWLPAGILDRRKMGFGVPLHRWFREELRDMAYDVLLGQRARERGYFEPAAVRRLLDEHVAGTALHHHRLWNLLMLEWWHRTWIDQPPPPAPPRAALADVREPVAGGARA